MNWQLANTRNLWIIGILLHLICAYISSGFIHVDEHFQLLEFANFKMGGISANEMPWEWHEYLRPTAQPYFAYYVMQFAKLLGIVNPFTISMILRIISAAIALISIHFFGKYAFGYKSQNYNIFVAFSLLTWFATYQHVRFSSENWGGIFLLLGIGFVLNKKWFLSGLILGLSFLFRYQMALSIVGILAWLIAIEKLSWRKLITFISGILLAIILGILSDYQFYGKWVFTAYNYFSVNLIQGKAAEFGTDPFYYYILKFLEQGFMPISFLLLTFLIIAIFKNPKHISIWAFVPFVAIHFIISHKEIRFLFPMIYLLPIFATLVFSYVKKIYAQKFWRILVNLILILNFILIPFSIIKSYNARIALLQHLYDNPPQQPIYSLHTNPYYDNAWFRFYDPHNLSRNIIVVEETDNVPKGSILIVPEYKLIPQNPTFKPTYIQVPEWIDKINQTHWVERANYWSIYEKL